MFSPQTVTRTGRSSTVVLLVPDSSARARRHEPHTLLTVRHPWLVVGPGRGLMASAGSLSRHTTYRDAHGTHPAKEIHVRRRKPHRKLEVRHERQRRQD